MTMVTTTTITEEEANLILETLLDCAGVSGDQELATESPLGECS
jgi:hypothetical protein